MIKAVVNALLNVINVYKNQANVFINALKELVKLFVIHAKHVRSVLIALEV